MRLVDDRHRARRALRIGAWAVATVLFAVLAALPGAWGPAAAQELEDDAGLTDEESEEVTNFLLGNTLYILFHEIGHALIDLYQLPVLGREEDAADNLATLIMIPDEDDEDDTLGDLLLAAAEGWHLSHLASTDSVEDLAFWDEHGLDMQRYYSIVCLLYGSDPERYGETAEAVELPEERRETCPEDYEKASTSWESLLAPHVAEDGKTGEPIEVVYNDATGDLEEYADLLKELELMETVAEEIMSSFVLPESITLRAESCDEGNAYWISDERVIVLCYELLAEQRQQIIEDIRSR